MTKTKKNIKKKGGLKNSPTSTIESYNLSPLQSSAYHPNNLYLTSHGKKSTRRLNKINLIRPRILFKNNNNELNQQQNLDTHTNKLNNLAILNGNQVNLLNMYHSNKYQNIKKYIPQLHNLASKKGLKIKVSAKKKIKRPNESLILRLRPETNLYIFFKEHIDRLFIENESNKFLNEVQNILNISNQEFSDFNNIRLINLFTEEFIFVKKNNENDNLLFEPLIFSVMEMQIFNDYNDLFNEEMSEEVNNEIENNRLLNEFNSKNSIEGLNNISEILNKKKKELKLNKKQSENIKKFLYKMFENGYDIELNPFIIKNIGLFKILHNYFESKKIKKGGNQTTMIDKTATEVVRQNINSFHNLGYKWNTINQSIERNLKNRKRIMNQSIVKRVKKNNTISINDECVIESYTPNPVITNYNERIQKKETHEEIKIEKFKSNQCSIITKIKPLSGTDINKKTFNPCFSDIEEKYLLYLMKENLIGNNVFYFVFNKWNDPVKILYFKELFYNILGRYQFIINDANGLSHVLKFIYETGKDEGRNENLKDLFRFYFIMKTSVLKDDKLFVLESELKNLDLTTIQTRINLFTTKQEKIVEKFEEKALVEINKIKSKLQKKFNDLIILDLDKVNQKNKKKTILFIDNKSSELIKILKTITKIKEINKLRNIITNVIKTSITPTNLIQSSINDQKKTFKKYVKNTLSSWGMKLDPGTLGGTNDVQLFSTSLYEKLLLDIFSDLQLEGCTIEIEFNKKNIEIINEHGIVINTINKINDLSSFDIIFEKNGYKNKVKFYVNGDLNTIDIILSIIKELLELYKFEIMRKSISNNNALRLPINNDLILNSKILNQSILKINKNKVFEKVKKKKEIKEETFNSYYQLIQILFNMNYSFNEVIKFILRFKIMGDKIQALEAKYRCSLLKDYDSTPEDILIQKRILATQDRPLAAFAMVENNINFISKATLKDKKVVFWNFGDINYGSIGNIENENKFLPAFKLYSFALLSKFEKIKNLNIDPDLITKYEPIFKLIKDINEKIKLMNPLIVKKKPIK
jgi:hypothetical protein